MKPTPEKGLPRNVWLWDERVTLIDPSDGSRVIDNEPLGDWLTERTGQSDERPSKEFLNECANEIRRRYESACDYIVQVKAVYREYKYVREASGLLRTVPA